MKYFLPIIFLLFSSNIFAQQNKIYIKFTSDKIKKPRSATIYVTTTNVVSYSFPIPSNNFYIIKCDSTKAVSILSDVLKYPDFQYLSFKIPGKFNCGDSIVVDIDNDQATVINKKISTK